MLDVLGIAGVVGSGVGLGLNSVPLEIFGMIAIILTFVGIGVNRGNTQKLIGEQKRMSVKSPTCPKCGRELRQEGLSFCPYCGSSLTLPL